MRGEQAEQGLQRVPGEVVERLAEGGQRERHGGAVGDQAEVRGIEGEPQPADRRPAHRDADPVGLQPGGAEVEHGPLRVDRGAAQREGADQAGQQAGVAGAEVEGGELDREGALDRRTALAEGVDPGGAGEGDVHLGGRHHVHLQLETVGERHPPRVGGGAGAGDGGADRAGRAEDVAQHAEQLGDRLGVRGEQGAPVAPDRAHRVGGEVRRARSWARSGARPVRPGRAAAALRRRGHRARRAGRRRPGRPPPRRRPSGRRSR